MERSLALVKGLILAVAATALAVVLATLMFRAVTTTRRVPVLLGVWLATLAVYAIAFALTPADLGVLPPALVERLPWVEALFGLVVHAALFFGGLLQVYNLAERGFSLRILIDVAEAPSRALTAPDVCDRYAAGRGVAWMLDKRLRDLVDHDYIRLDGGRYCVTPRGLRTARVFGGLRRFVRLDRAS